MKNLVAVCALVSLSACGGDDPPPTESGDGVNGEEQEDEADDEGVSDVEGDGEASAQVQTTATLAAEYGVEAKAITSLEACANSHTEADLAASAKLAYDTDASIHELIACGGLTIRVAIGLVTGVVSLVLDDEDAMPSGLSYEGEGAYVSESSLGDSSMEMRVRLYEAEGEEFILVEDNLFDAKNYLTGVSVDADASADVDFDIGDPLDTSVSADASVHIEYEEAGPWAKLLGLGDPPPNPIQLGDVAEINPDFSDIYIQSEIDVRDVRGDSVVHFVVNTQMMGLVEMFTTGGLTYEIDSLEASNENLGQTLVMDAWEVDFGEHNHLNGDVSFTVEAEAEASVGYEATLAYRDAAYGDVELSCID